MIDYQEIFHTGIRVPDLDAAMEQLGATLGLTWAKPQHVDAQPVWTPASGQQAVPLRFVYSAEGPQHVELLEGQPGTVWDGTQQPGVHHVGVWVDDVAVEAQRAIDAGWAVAASQQAPEDGFGAYAYVQPPAGPIVELVWSAIRPRFEAWWAGGDL